MVAALDIDDPGEGELGAFTQAGGGLCDIAQIIIDGLQEMTSRRLR
jgi:hypothetical protein